MGNKRRPRKESIEELKEWQDNQYNPGYYTGGKIPPYVDIPPKTGLFGKFYVKAAKLVGVIDILAGAGLIFIGAIIISGLYASWGWRRAWDYIGITVIFGSLGLLFILYGLKYIRNVNPKVKKRS